MISKHSCSNQRYIVCSPLASDNSYIDSSQQKWQ